MKNMASCYLEPLEHIINLSMTTGIVPYELKKARIEDDKNLDYILQSEKLHFHIRQLNLEESQFTTT